MFSSVGWGEMGLLIVVGLFVFGPERLPTLVKDAARTIRKLREMANGMTEDLKAELGPEMADLDIRSLHPRALVRKHLLDDLDDTPARPASPTTLPSVPGAPAPVGVPRQARVAGALPSYDPDTT